MHFLVDESCDAAIGRALSQAGHDVLEVRDANPGADDENLPGSFVTMTPRRIRIGRMPGISP